MWLIAILAILAFVSDAVIHVAAVVGFNPQNWIQPAWLTMVLYYGLFGVMMAIVITREVLRKRRAKMRGVVLADDTNPLWFKGLARIVAVYAFITAADVLFRANGGELSHPEPGVYLVDPGHGHPIERITEDRYNRYRRNEVRLVSAFFLVFYFQFAFDFLCAAMGKDWGNGPSTARRNSGRWIFVVWRSSRTATKDISEIR